MKNDDLANSQNKILFLCHINWQVYYQSITKN